MAIPDAISGVWTRSLRAQDLATKGCLEWIAFSAKLGCLLGGTGGHSCSYAVDVSTLALRELAAIECIATPFPGGGIAIGALPALGADLAAGRLLRGGEQHAALLRPRAGHDRVLLLQRTAAAGHGGVLRVRREPSPSPRSRRAA